MHKSESRKEAEDFLPRSLGVCRPRLPGPLPAPPEPVPEPGPEPIPVRMDSSDFWWWARCWETVASASRISSW
ncbi:hypothetical protein TYRP_006589 [Tyrophagus putrescentiae]|nr:hypothetical protein TYRP_006589 [Tyrophagus putrescentiae]